MKNLKRILCFVIAMTMLLSFNVSVSAAEYSDIPEEHKYAEAINLLSGLGILTGYQDGTFKPEGTITRAEAATVIVRVLGLEDNVDKGDTIFPDVTARHWASGYVNTAVSNGIINGFPDGNFYPDDLVTYEQIVKMVVCAIGHDVKADAYGGFPEGHIRAASEAKVTKGISGSGKEPALRGLVAQLVYNALEVEMMDATSFNTGVLGTSYSYNGKTLLRDYLEIEKVDAIVTDTYLTAESFDSRDKYIELDIKKVYGFDDRSSRYLYDEGIAEFFEGEYSDASVFLGYAITAYVGEDENGDNTIFAITSDTARNTTVEVVKDRFFAKESSDEVISYTKRATDNRLTELELDKNVEVVVNGEIVNNSVTYYFDTFDVMTLVDNNRDKEYDFVFISEFDETEGVEFVVEEIDEDDDVYYFEGEDGEIELDFDNPDVLITIIRDGKIAEADDIEVGDVITCLNAARDILTVYVSSETVRGEVEEVDKAENEYYIDNKAYSLSPAFAETFTAGDEGIFYLNYQGKIAYSTVSKTITAGDYIFVTGYDSEYRYGKTTCYIQAVNGEGEVKEYTLKPSKMRYVNAQGNLFKSVSGETVFNYMTTNKTDLSHTYDVDGYVGLVKVKASNAGIISEVYFPGSYEEFFEQTRYATTNTKEYSKKRGTYGAFDLDGNVIVFRIDDKEEDLIEAIEVGEVSEFFTDGDNYTFLAYGERGEDVEILVVTDGIATANYQEHALIITKISQVVANGEPTDKITGIQNEKTVSYTVDPDERFDVRVGNIVLVGANAEGFVTKLELVADTTDDPWDLYYAFDGVDIPSDEEAGVYGGMVSEKKDKRFEIADIDESFYNDDTVAYTLIDYTYTGRELKIAKCDFNDIKLNKNYDAFAVVRTYEDNVIDAFIFRLEAGKMDVPSVDVWNDLFVPVEPGTEAPEEPTTAPTEPTTAPTEEPESSETNEPTTAPTEEPESTETNEPTTAPTEEPESTETNEPTTAPTEEPESSETNEPTTAPTEEPESTETNEPTTAPTEEPESTETNEPTTAPTEEPESSETNEPTTAPTEEPESSETNEPTTAPTEEPESSETNEPTTAPTEPATDNGPILAQVEKKVTVNDKLEKEILILINAERVKAGLKPVELDSNVAKVAQAHSVDMATNNYLNQVSKSGVTLQTRLANAKIVFAGAAENLAKGTYTSAVIVDAWMKSANHKVNILNAEFTKIGIGVAVAVDGTHYWTVDFIK